MYEKNNKKNIAEINKEKIQKGFTCCNCNIKVVFSNTLGTAHRNHCPKCLYSLHLDKEFSGDRRASCGGHMRPIGLTFKKEGHDKYGHDKEGELMIIHECSACERISINRLAADDDERAILVLFNQSLTISEEAIKKISNEGIVLAIAEDKKKVFIKLFGKSINQFKIT